MDCTGLESSCRCELSPLGRFQNASREKQRKGEEKKFKKHEEYPGQVWDGGITLADDYHPERPVADKFKAADVLANEKKEGSQGGSTGKQHDGGLCD